MSGYHRDDKCPGSGKPPRQVHQLGDGADAWEIGDCAVCGRNWCNLTKAGMIHAHKKENDVPRIDLIMATLRSAQELIDSALRAVEKLEPDYLCTMNSECPNR